MDFVVVCKSQSTLKQCCEDLNVSTEDVYIVNARSDLAYAKRETENKPRILILAQDWRETEIKDEDANDFILETIT